MTSQHTGRLLRTLHTGSGNLFFLWLAFFRSHLSTLIAVLVMIPLALRINWQLALVMIVLMVTFVLFNTIVVRRTGNAQRKVEQLNQEISERAGDVFGNVLVVQSFSRVVSEVAALRQLVGQVLTAQYPVLRGWAWVSVANRAASTLTVIGIFALGVQLHGKGAISVGSIVSFVGFAHDDDRAHGAAGGLHLGAVLPGAGAGELLRYPGCPRQRCRRSPARRRCATCAARSLSRTSPSAMSAAHAVSGI